MTRDDIILIAKDVFGPHEFSKHGLLRLEHFATLVAAAEREACMKIVKEYQIPVDSSRAGELVCEWNVHTMSSARTARENEV